MRRTGATLAVVLIAASLSMRAGQGSEAPNPVRISEAQIAGAIFKDYEPIVTKHDNERGAYTTEDVEAFLSTDGHFDAGMYRSGPNRFEINEPYGVDEFMYFLKGGVTLTSSDGAVQKIRAGDAVVIPKEWTGVWETDGYTKIYVIYSADKPIE
jgi:uncharacterized cupin superfamily protein